MADSTASTEMLRDFAEFGKKRRALLVLTPLTVVGDIVTFPIQLLMLIGD